MVIMALRSPYFEHYKGNSQDKMVLFSPPRLLPPFPLATATPQSMEENRNNINTVVNVVPTSLPSAEHDGKGKPYVCTLCGRGFSQKGNLKTHLRIHTNDKPYTCEFCRKRFTQKIHLKTHVRTHTNERPFPCQHCNKSFSRKVYLKNHIRTHTKEKPKQESNNQDKLDQYSPSRQLIQLSMFPLPPANQQQETEIHLNSHFKTAIANHYHNNIIEKPFHCTLCGQGFSQKYNLKIHIRNVHISEKPHQCEFCQKRFTQKIHLKTHHTTHSNEKPFSCDHCQKTFARKIYLKNHLRTHTKEKPFVCLLCGKSFAQKGHLKTHAHVHSNERPFLCPFCEKSFSRKGNLQTHLRTHGRQALSLLG